jgi:hypothetical protein
MALRSFVGGKERNKHEGGRPAKTVQRKVVEQVSRFRAWPLYSGGVLLPGRTHR